MNLLKVSFPYLIAFFLGCYVSGLYFINQINQREISALKLKMAEETTVINLIQGNVTQNEKLSLEFEQRQNALKNTNQILKRSISDAIKNDINSSGNCYNGLGSNSLQLYKRALGYYDNIKTSGSLNSVANEATSAKIR